MSNTSNTMRTDLLKLLFQNVALAGLGDTSGLQPSGAAGNVYIRLCTDATVADAATVGAECAYTGYVAKGIAVARSSGAFSVATNAAKNIAEILFGACTAGTENIKYVEAWKNNTGGTLADRISFCEITPFAVSSGKHPKIAAEACTFTLV